MADSTATLEDWKSIKVPAWAYDNARLAARELARRGTLSVAEKMPSQMKCQGCDGKLASRLCGELKVLHCAACGFTRPDMGSTSSITTGIVIGLALALLIEKMSG
jgi:hypothetical protein